MYARKVSLQLKPHSVAEFTQHHRERHHSLAAQTARLPGARLRSSSPGGTEAVSVSLWDQKEHAEAYHRGTYPAVLRALANVLEGTPQVHTYEVSNSTFHKIVARNAA